MAIRFYGLHWMGIPSWYLEAIRMLYKNNKAFIVFGGITQFAILTHIARDSAGVPPFWTRIRFSAGSISAVLVMEVNWLAVGVCCLCRRPGDGLSRYVS